MFNSLSAISTCAKIMLSLCLFFSCAQPQKRVTPDFPLTEPSSKKQCLGELTSDSYGNKIYTLFSEKLINAGFIFDQEERNQCNDQEQLDYAMTSIERLIDGVSALLTEISDDSQLKEELASMVGRAEDKLLPPLCTPFWLLMRWGASVIIKNHKQNIFSLVIENYDSLRNHLLDTLAQHHELIDEPTSLPFLLLDANNNDYSELLIPRQAIMLAGHKEMLTLLLALTHSNEGHWIADQLSLIRHFIQLAIEFEKTSAITHPLLAIAIDHFNNLLTSQAITPEKKEEILHRYIALHTGQWATEWIDLLIKSYLPYPQIRDLIMRPKRQKINCEVPSIFFLALKNAQLDFIKLFFSWYNDNSLQSVTMIEQHAATAYFFKKNNIVYIHTPLLYVDYRLNKLYQKIISVDQHLQQNDLLSHQQAFLQRKKMIYLAKKERFTQIKQLLEQYFVRHP